MANNRDFYKTLGVPPNADKEAIKRAYREQIRRSHPDRFAAERSAMEQAGDQAGLRAVERKIEQAVKRTQAINEAYAVLTDPDRRAFYDRMRRQPAQPTTTRRTVKTRPHHQARRHSARPGAPRPSASKQESVPWGWMVGLTIVLLVGFTGVSTLLYSPRDFVVDGNGTPENYVPVGSTDATATAYASRPTATPLSADSLVATGDTFYELGEYRYAVEAYSDAIERDSQHIAARVQRARAYAALAQTPVAEGQGPPGDLPLTDLALIDLTFAIVIDPTRPEPHLLRGTLYYNRWQGTGQQDEGLAAAARADLERYLLLQSEPDADVQAMLTELP